MVPRLGRSGSFDPGRAAPGSGGALGEGGEVLRRADLVRDTPVAQFVLYRLRRDPGPQGRLLSAILDAMVHEDPALRREREQAADRSRTHTRSRVGAREPEKATRAKRPS